jgi:ParB family chromosome partitioning protein
MNKTSRTKKRRALGRGLSNLIPTESAQEQESEMGGAAAGQRSGGPVSIDIGAITVNPFQPRTDFDDGEIAGLARSIDAQGLLQPVVVRQKVDGAFEIISGERRFRAMKSLGWDQIPCLIKEKVSDREMLEMALVENIQRENLNEIETAQAYQQLLLECGLSHEELSKQVGKSRSAISNSLRLLKLPASIQQQVRRGELSMGHARALLSIDDVNRQKQLADSVVEQRLNVRQTEALIQKIKGGGTPQQPAAQKRDAAQTAAPLDPDLVHVQEQLCYRYGTAVKLLPAGDKGRIEIRYHSGEDLTRICDLLLNIPNG